LANARVAGLQKYLGMTNKQYSIALTVTYVPYIVAELPSNLLLKVRLNILCYVHPMLTWIGCGTQSDAAYDADTLGSCNYFARYISPFHL
jgi:hypothetical protein